MDAQETWGNNTKNGFCRSVCRAFNWAVRQGHIDKSPVKGVEKPPTERREDVVTPAEFERILAMFPDQPFRDLLITVWETGCRPQEVLGVEKKDVDEKGKRWVFTIKGSKGKKKSRVVYLSDKAFEITARLIEVHPTGKLFRNRDGEPWDRHTINRRFLRKKKKLGRKLCLYVLRHSFCQRMLLAGVDTLTVSLLMGHASTKMIMEHYQHLHSSPEHFAKALNGGAASAAESQPASPPPPARTSSGPDTPEGHPQAPG
jgi:integrase